MFHQRKVNLHPVYQVILALTFLVTLADGQQAERRFCCDALRIVQENFRPRECLTVHECVDRSEREKEIVRLYGCTDPTAEVEFIRFPDAIVSTDRLAGWYPFQESGSGGVGSSGRSGSKWVWDARAQDNVIVSANVAELTVSKENSTFYDGDRIGGIFILHGSEVFNVPNQVILYDEPCRAYNPEKTDYQNLPGNRVYNYIDLTQYTDCEYVLHFSFARDAYKVTRPYFNERDEHEVREQLQDPNSTSYFDEVTTKDSTKGYFAFPYFLIVRLACQDQGYYGEEFYELAASGYNPQVNLFYSPPTSHSHFENPISLSMTPALINLEQDEERLMVPEPDPRIDTQLADREFYTLGNRKRICYLNLCHPGYAMPQPFLQIPILQVNIPDARNVAMYRKNIYVNPFHARTTTATGEVQVGQKFPNPTPNGPSLTSVHPRYFFPKNRFTELDTELDQENLHMCTISEASRQRYELDIPRSFYLEGREQFLAWIILEMETMKKSLPLTRDDFFAPQYPLHTAPVVAIAGFFQPNLVLLGDPEMDVIHLLEWGFNPRSDADSMIFDSNGGCLTPENFIKTSTDPNERPTIQKPMYSLRQKDDLRKYFPGRRSYFPVNYDVDSRRAIFEIINLEDRLLLKTTSGIVALYGNSNATKGVDKIWKAPEAEKIRRCFKVITSLKMVLADFEPLVGITYNYASNPQQNEAHVQEIWYGEYRQPGQPIKWTELGSKEYQDNLSPPVHIDPGITTEEKSTNIPEALKICKAVYSKHVLSLFPNDVNRTAYRWLTEPDHHNCIIVDGTPKPTEPNVVQLLVEMTFTFYKEHTCNPDSPDFQGQCEPFVKPKCVRYHYCMFLVDKASKAKGNTTKPVVTAPEPCKVIPAIDCTQVPCYTLPTLSCSKNCTCPACETVKTCPASHCHPECDVCPDMHYFPRRCDCPRVLSGGGTLAPPCEGNDLDSCTPCPTDATDCHKTPFGPCRPGLPHFCPKSVLKLRQSPYCPKCLQNFYETVEGSYEYPMKEKVYGPDDNAEPMPSDLQLCQTMVTGKKEEDYCKYSVQDIKLFIIAQHRVGQPVVDGNSWEIVSIFPKVPCTNPHFERIYNMRSLDEAYFGDTRIPMENRKSCFETFSRDPNADLAMNRFTYTRQINNHLFIYGPKLYHSLDGGYTLVLMRDFPKRPPIFNSLDYDMVKLLDSHQIMVMAFSTGAMYAFLTSKRELWLGTTGSIRQARLRPGDGWSMMGLRLYKNKVGVPDGIPFSVMFDSFDNLIELVALRDAEGHIDEIMKREVDLQLILRNNYFVQELQKHVNQQLRVALRTGANDDFNNGTVTVPLIPKETLNIHFEIQELSLYCPFSQIKIFQNYSRTLNRLQRFQFNPPIQHFLLGIDHKPASLMAYSVATFGIVYETFLKKTNDETYSKVKRDPIEKWQIAKTEEAYIGYIRYLKKNPRKNGIVVDPREAAMRIIDTSNSSTVGQNFVAKFWLNYNQIIRLEIDFYIKNAQLLTKTDFLLQKLSEIQINVDNGNGEIVRLNTERQVVAKSASVKFIAHISLFENEKLIPSQPGQGLVPVPLTFHLIGGFGKCFQLEHWGMVGESLTTTVIAGCPPATGLLFDWNSTLYSLRFRSTTLKYGDESYCGKGEQVCFSMKESITFHFDILDLSNQRFIPFDGKFKLQVIGGGRTNDSIRTYNSDQIDAYNIPGKSDISLIWTIAPENNETNVEKDPESQENVLRAGVTQIKFTCNTLSPCARIRPSWNLQTNFYFLIRITNKGVDKETLCLHEREFIIMLYGFTPSPEVQLLLTLLGCLLIITIMYIFFLCCRRHRKVWRANKRRFMGWWKIVVDTFPKSIKEGATIAEVHRKRDSIILSLQGHLNVPQIITNAERLEDDEDLPSEQGSSEDKLSALSRGSDESVTSLPRVRPRKKGATWTDMVYEQIISQRLLAIVNRNRRMREHVLQSPVPQIDPSDMGVMEQDSVKSLPDGGTEQKKDEKKPN